MNSRGDQLSLEIGSYDVYKSCGERRSVCGHKSKEQGMERVYNTNDCSKSGVEAHEQSHDCNAVNAGNAQQRVKAFEHAWLCYSRLVVNGSVSWKIKHRCSMISSVLAVTLHICHRRRAAGLLIGCGAETPAMGSGSAENEQQLPLRLLDSHKE